MPWSTLDIMSLREEFVAAPRLGRSQARTAPERPRPGLSGSKHRQFHPQTPRPHQRPGHQRGHAWQRFEHDAPNSLWQIDFKGYTSTSTKRCSSLTLPGRPLPGLARLRSPANGQCEEPAAGRLLPLRSAGAHQCGQRRALRQPARATPTQRARAVLIRLGVRVSFSSPHHPQTNGRTSASIAA